MWIIFIALAAALNAVMDILENENFTSSVFRNLNPKFWYKRESWKYATKILGWKLDAWHIAKTLMVTCIAFSIPAYELFGRIQIAWWVDVILAGFIWNIVFGIVYKILKK